ncbi:hypothetical protein BpHYR1_023467 [Brachionus plicatilis]|uniref:Uncharacterized protein n=1 Tax=Brachionus plicatilis TaxID=10195 RepID=A0A3M7QBP3_BRAPC|nr:hypothetical protein BpHYR1_023467 [Brachionus plicatilis]
MKKIKSWFLGKKNFFFIYKRWYVEYQFKAVFNLNQLINNLCGRDCEVNMKLTKWLVTRLEQAGVSSNPGLRLMICREYLVLNCTFGDYNDYADEEFNDKNKKKTKIITQYFKGFDIKLTDINFLTLIYSKSGLVTTLVINFYDQVFF